MTNDAQRLQNIVDNNNQSTRLKAALQDNPELATLLFSLLIRLLAFLHEWFLDEKGERLPFFKAVGAFFSKEFWLAVRKLQAETVALSRKI